GDSELVAYVNNQTRFGMSDVGQLVTRVLGGEENPVIEHDAGLYFSDLALGGFGVDGASGGVLGWVAQGAEGSAVQFQRLEAASGQPVGDIVTLTTEVGAAANVDFAVQPRNDASLGALVYTESPG